MDAPADAFWNRPLAALLDTLKTSASGLAQADAAQRLARDGPNDTTAVKRAPAWLRFLARFRSPLVLILLVASGISGLTGDVASFAIISGIVVLSVTLDFVQEWRAQTAVDALRARIALKATAMRDGKPAATLVNALVRGDVVELSAGDVIPADGRVLEAHDFFVNQALMTGEPYPVEKHAGDLAQPADELAQATNSLFAGSSVISGSAVLLVVRTGRATAVGDIAASLAAAAPPTAFERGVQRFGTLILRMTVILVIFVLAESLFFHRPWLESLLFALALAVGLTPELLPMILTVTLSRGAVRLAKRQVVVKRLPAIHNLGAMDVLCTDKTGTLTEARIDLVRHIDPKGADSERVFTLAYLNSHFETGLKSALDDAILAHETADIGGWSKIDEVPFDFERRRVSVLAENAGARTLIVKGAPEDVLALCTGYETDGKTFPLTKDQRARIDALYAGLGADGFRALGVAFRAEAKDCAKVVIGDEADLTFAGFALFLDPPKTSAGAAVKALAQAGVAVKIITGDNEQVARHVCETLKVRITGLILGKQLDAMSDEALLGAARKTNLFCRVNPQQKLRIIRALQHAGLTVGYLGDGINDAPSLHAADVGISVDGGTDVAKAAADMVLLEQDLMVLRDGVIEGRKTVINVDKYMLMASSANFGNIVSMAIASLILPFLPLLPIQVLLTNLIYDVAQIGLPVDNVDEAAVKKPVHWDIKAIQGFMLAAGPVSTIFDMATFAVLLLILHVNVAQFRTGWFVESLVTQILMIFIVRTRRNPLRSRPHWAVVALALGACALTLLLPIAPFGAWFSFTPLKPVYFAYLVAAVAGFLAMMELVTQVYFKLLARRRKHPRRRPTRRLPHPA
jgi:Mg2+-importing ATPase